MSASEKRLNIQPAFPDKPAPGETQPVADGVHWLRMPLPFVLGHINLWLFKGRPPVNQQEFTVVVNKFVYVPLENIEDTDETFTPDVTAPQAAKHHGH